MSADMFTAITTEIRAPKGESTYLNSRAAFDARNAWAQSLRPGSTWSFETTDESGAVIAHGHGFATHGEAVKAMYAADDRFTVVTAINADSTTWSVVASGQDRRIIGTARVFLTMALTLTIHHEPHSFYDGFATEPIHFSEQSTFRSFAHTLATYASDHGLGWDSDPADWDGVTGLFYRNGRNVGYWAALRNTEGIAR